jgi:serine protease AprX
MKHLVAVVLMGVSSAAFAADWSAKAEPELLAATADGGQADFIVRLADRADYSAAATAADKKEKGRIVVEALKAAAARSQPALIQFMQARGMPVQAFWVGNAIVTRGTDEDVRAVALRSEVESLHRIKNDIVLGPYWPGREPKAEPNTEDGIADGLEVVNAPQVWAMGFRGQGVVAGDHDIGVQWDHPALINQYRGWNGSTADHAYNWHNAVPADPFCSDPEVPCDSHGHGTHTTGTMVGDDGEGNQVGMAPAAKWMACRSLIDPVVGVGTLPTYLECMEWQLAPYPTGNPGAADPAMAPDVVSNSWGCLEACAPPLLKDVNDAIYAAGIVQVVSAGNDGSQCSTLAFPLAVYESSFTVGATNVSDQMAGFSSRGPVLSDGSMRTKPNVVAPGVSTVSAWNDGGYNSISGTSMAGPHVAGAVALLLSAEPKLIGRVADVRNLFEQTAVPIMTTQVCGGTGQDDIPNNIFGYGRIDVLAAVLARPQLNIEAQAAVGEDGDVAYTVTVSVPEAAKTAATAVVLDVSLPEGVTTAEAGAPLRFERASLAPGESWAVELALRASGDGSHQLLSTAESEQVSAVSVITVVESVTPPAPEPPAAPVEFPEGEGLFGGALGTGLLILLAGLAARRRRR